MQELALGDWDDLQMGLKYHIIPRPQRRQETIASMLVLIWTHVGPTSPSPKIARQGYGGRLPLCGISAGLENSRQRDGTAGLSSDLVIRRCRLNVWFARKRTCTLLELSQGKCRWPISNPGAEDFCFCGNEPVKGLPYCLGHARIAYRPTAIAAARVRER